MATNTRTAVSLLAGVLGFGAFCVGTVAFVGKQIDDNQVAVGRVSGWEQTRARIGEQERLFQAMTPAQHFAAAQAALALPIRPEEGYYGDLTGSRRHLTVLPSGSPESAQAVPLLAEITRRETESLRFAQAAIVRLGAQLPATQDPAELARQRHQLARLLDGKPNIGCVHDVGDNGTVLRFDNCLCDAAFLQRMTDAPSREVIRRVGFTRVQCKNGSPPPGFAP